MANWTVNLDILRTKKLTQFRKKSKTKNLQTTTKYPLKYGRQGISTIYFFDYRRLWINKREIDKRLHLCFTRREYLRINKKLKIINHPIITANVYDVILNSISSELEKILWRKNKNGIYRNRSTVTICRTLEGVWTKRLRGNTFVCMHLIPNREKIVFVTAGEFQKCNLDVRTL